MQKVATRPQYDIHEREHELAMSAKSDTILRFKGLYSTAPETIVEAFAAAPGAPKIKRITQEKIVKSVLWEDAETKALSGRDPTFPQVVMDIKNNLPVEVAIIGSFPPGEGETYVHSALELQKGHATYVDEYNEESAKICNTDYPRGDTTTMYTFSVAGKDLVFHRHEGHRALSGITGGHGGIMRFSGASPEECAKDPKIFVEKMFFIELPPDSLFTLRFHGTVYHQFGPMVPGRNTFFAVSVHTNEVGGLTGELLEKVKAGGASIPLLTEPANDRVYDLLEKSDLKQEQVFERSRRTVSETKRYLLRTRTPGSTLIENAGNHSVPPQPVSQEINSLLLSEELMSTVPVFKLPKVGKPSSVEETVIWVVEFKDSGTAEKARKASVTVAGHPVTFL